jgi:monoamine oxidase
LEKYAWFNEETLQETFSHGLSLIKIAYKLSNQKSPCIARDKNFAIYNQSVGYSWAEDTFAQGSYSYIQAGQEEIFTAQQEYQGEKVRSLFAPIDNLFFAGEHTTILLDVLGTMEAAVESGERIARIIGRLLDCV